MLPSFWLGHFIRKLFTSEKFDTGWENKKYDDNMQNVATGSENS
jgi:hypothetical protein